MKSRTEFLERAIEAYVQDLRDSKVVIMKNWTEPKARAAVVKHLRRHPSAFGSEICETLAIDFELGFCVVGRLMEDGLVDRTASCDRYLRRGRIARADRET